MKDFVVKSISQVLLHKNQQRNLSGMQQEALLSQHTLSKSKCKTYQQHRLSFKWREDQRLGPFNSLPYTEALVQPTFPYVCGDIPAPCG